MDALRGIAMLLGIVLHAAIPYRIHTNVNWPTDPDFQSVTFDLLYLWIHSFRMQLFFLVAGFFARLLYLKIGFRNFIQHRLKRILLPFIVSIIIIVPLSIAPLLYYKYAFFQGLSVDEALNNTLKGILHWNGLVHLWFLYYLMMFYISMLAILVLTPIKIKSLIQSKLNIFANFTRPIIFIFFAIFLFSVLYYQNKIIIEPYTGLKPNVGQFVYYGIFFFIGYLLHANVSCIESIKRVSLRYFSLGSLLAIPFTYCYFLLADNPESSPLLYNLARILGVCLTLLLVGGALGGFIQFFSKENRILRYISDSAYWLYLVHFPIVVFTEILLLYSNVYGWARFWIVLSIASIVTLITYQHFARYTIIGNILHGKRLRGETAKTRVKSVLN